MKWMRVYLGGMVLPRQGVVHCCTWAVLPSQAALLLLNADSSAFLWGSIHRYTQLKNMEQISLCGPLLEMKKTNGCMEM